MKCIEFEGQNLMLGPPSSMPRGSCGILPCVRQSDRFISAWRPTAEEIEALKSGAHVVLTVLSDTHPPVMMHVQKMREMP